MSDSHFDEERFKAATEGTVFDENTPLAMYAATNLEYYQAQLKAGFSEKQAIYLTGCVVTGNPGIPPQST